MANESNGRAEMAFDKATEAQDRADRAEKQAKDATVRASDNEKEAARLNKLAQDEALARTQLQARIAPRTLNQAQRDFFQKALRPFVIGFFGRRPVLLRWSPVDPEQAILGIEIEDALTRAGIPVERNTPFVLGVGLQIGIWGFTPMSTVTGSPACCGPYSQATKLSLSLRQGLDTLPIPKQAFSGSRQSRAKPRSADAL